MLYLDMNNIYSDIILTGTRVWKSNLKWASSLDPKDAYRKLEIWKLYITYTQIKLIMR